MAGQPVPGESPLDLPNASTQASTTQWQRWLALLAATASLLGLAGCAVAVTVSVVKRGPIHNFDGYLRDAVPFLVLALIWFMVGATSNVRERRSKDTKARGIPSRSRVSIRSSGWQTKVLLWASFAFVVATVAIAAKDLSGGTPDPANVGCQYALKSDHGIICVSRQRYRNAEAAQDRLFAGGIGLLLAANLSFSIARLHRL